VFPNQAAGINLTSRERDQQLWSRMFAYVRESQLSNNSEKIVFSEPTPMKKKLVKHAEKENKVQLQQQAQKLKQFFEGEPSSQRSRSRII
jgi:hypothetical protein